MNIDSINKHDAIFSTYIDQILIIIGDFFLNPSTQVIQIIENSHVLKHIFLSFLFFFFNFYIAQLVQKIKSATND
jgi:hypothetical protein